MAQILSNVVRCNKIYLEIKEKITMSMKTTAVAVALISAFSITTAFAATAPAKAPAKPVAKAAMHKAPVKKVPAKKAMTKKAAPAKKG